MWSTVQKAILSVMVLVVLLIVLKPLYDPLVDQVAEIVQNTLNPLGQPVPFPENDERDPALDSVYGLLYGINLVSWYNTNFPSTNSIDDINFFGDPYTAMSKSFGNVDVTPVVLDSEVTSMEGVSKEHAKLEMGKSLVDCYYLFEDRGRENSRCFTFDFSGFSGTLNEEDIEEGLRNYKQVNVCDSSCQSTVDRILGDSIFREREFKMSVQGDVINNQNIEVCAERRFLDFELLISDENNACDAQLPVQSLGVKIENFNLPQEYSRSGNFFIDSVENFLRANGDPKYLIYYEVFPDGEDEYWQLGAYQADMGAILAGEGAFFLLELIPIGGRVGKTLIRRVIGESGEKAIKELFQSVLKIANPTKFLTDGFKQSLRNTMDELLEGFVRAPLRTLTEIIEGILKETVDRTGREAFERAFTESLAREATDRELRTIVRSFSHVLNEEQEEVVERVLRNSMDDAVENFQGNIFRNSGEFTDEFKESLTRDIRVTLLTESDEITEDLATEITDRMLIELEQRIVLETGEAGLERSIAWAYRNAKGGNELLSQRLSVITDTMSREERERAVVAVLADADDYLRAMDPDDFQQFARHQKKNVQLAIDFQKTDETWLKDFLGQHLDISDARFNRMTQLEREAALEQVFDGMLQNVEVQQAAYNRARTLANLVDPNVQPRVATKNMLIASAIVLNGRAESIREKFVSQGTNSIAVRTPYMATVPYTVEEDISNYESFFKEYGGYVEGEFTDPYSRNRGLIPEISNYYLSLVKDKTRGLGEGQYNQRFHLVSPCNADIYVRVTQCECYGKPREERTYDNALVNLIMSREAIFETGEYNEYLQRTVGHFDGENTMLYTIAENNDIVKQCYPPNLIERTPFVQAQYEPTCLEINPVLNKNVNPNYCYKGKTPTYVKAVEIGLLYGLPIAGSIGGAEAGSALCGVGGALAGPAGAIGGAATCGALGSAVGGFLGGVSGSLAYGGIIGPRSAWPTHDFQLSLSEYEDAIGG